MDSSLEVIRFDEPIPGEPSEDNPFGGATGLVRRYDYLPYSHWRIKQLMMEQYGIELEYIHPGYKGGRYPGYVNSYRLKWADTGEIINPRVKLESLRYFLAREGHPLHPPKVKRNPGCVAFLEAVETLRKDSLFTSKKFE